MRGDKVMEKKKLSPEEVAKGRKRLNKLSKDNPLRRVLLKCEHGWVRDPLAVVGDWIWCERCSDTRRVIEVVE